MPVKNKYQSIIVVHHYHQNELKKSSIANYSGYVAGRSNLPFSIYPLSRFPLGERLGPLLPPWGKVGKGVEGKKGRLGSELQSGMEVTKVRVFRR
jgi:hypothetical protein